MDVTPLEATGSPYGDPVTAEQWRDASFRASDLCTDGAAPFLLRATIVAKGENGANESGQMGLRWNSRGHWRREIRIGSFTQIVTRIGDQMYKLPDAGYVPQIVTWVEQHYLPGCFHPPSSPADLKIGTIRNDIVTLSSRSPTLSPIVIQVSSRQLDRLGMSQWADYQPFRDKNIARKGGLTENNAVVEEFTIVELKDSPAADEATFVLKTAPVDVGNLGEKHAIVPVEAITRIRPNYTPMMRNASLSGQVQLQAVIGPDGQMHDLRVTQSSGSTLLDTAGLDAARQWTFKPATNDGKPIQTTYTFGFTFAHSGRVDFMNSLRGH